MEKVYLSRAKWKIRATNGRNGVGVWKTWSVGKGFLE